MSLLKLLILLYKYVPPAPEQLNDVKMSYLYFYMWLSYTSGLEGQIRSTQH